MDDTQASLSDGWFELTYWTYRVAAYAMLNLADEAAFLAILFC